MKSNLFYSSKHSSLVSKWDTLDPVAKKLISSDESALNVIIKWHKLQYLYSKSGSLRTIFVRSRNSIM